MRMPKRAAFEAKRTTEERVAKTADRSGGGPKYVQMTRLWEEKGEKGRGFGWKRDGGFRVRA